MPLYVGDYLRDTMHLKASEHGAYLLLIMQAWTRNGDLPTDLDRLRLMCRLDRDEWETCRNAVLPFFYIRDGFYRHKRIDAELAKTALIGDSKVRAGKLGAESRWKKDASDVVAPSDTSVSIRSKRLADARQKGSHTPDEWLAVVRYHDGLCAKCNAEVIGGTPTKDHIIPIYQGGSDAIENLQPLCRQCNSSKGSDTTDHRKSGWRSVMPSETPSETPDTMLNDARQTPAPSPSPSPIKKETTLRVAKKRSSVPPDWIPDANGLAYARDRGVTQAEVPKFRNYHTGKGSLMADWSAAWRTWCDNAVSFGKAPGLLLEQPEGSSSDYVPLPIGGTW